MDTFKNVPQVIVQALSDRGYLELTPVQKAMLDPDLNNKDILVSAQTGSGKTVAFGLALASDFLAGKKHLDPAGKPLALVIAPTRELALQVGRELEWLYANAGVVVSVCIGGMDLHRERRMLQRGAHIVVGTPGRLCDHIRGHALVMSGLNTIILDEADEMLDLGFREDIEFILDSSPSDRRMLMFSATVSSAIAKLAKSYQKNAVRINISSENRQHSDIDYRALMVAPGDRDTAIINVLRYYEAKNAIVFCGTRLSVANLTKTLGDRGFQVVALSGELSQKERSNALQTMRSGRARVCIATDVAARGIDLPDLELVIHAELPSNAETLLHRSGRTGRAGRKGTSVVIIPQNSRRRTESLLHTAGIKATWAAAPSVKEIISYDNKRILSNPLLDKPLQEDEKELVEALLGKHGPEQLAAGFLRLSRSGYCSPGELKDVNLKVNESRNREEFRAGGFAKTREGFNGSHWFSLSIGSKQNAEARWLIPMLCRSSGISRHEIGAIRVQPEKTFIEISEGGVEPLLRTKKLDKGIQITSLNGEQPEFKKRKSFNFKSQYQQESIYHKKRNGGSRSIV
ncbi:hypothetical protein B488_11540 [Liberibacter crescens BT-1]|uniref:ATP-dependent RNA helicase n=1 Tax=Liberibacter crescens (strain BT-1) TaxID=1215343 RepID=L0EXP8_LIBCB|nr:DEAD/DEAH box helicase [Liberibacter crescens]AGA65146.1 hypothetical protein B488_11540 [Liberibacter crescens BT-1]AMC13113.1 helicase [Liberibacter crescens]